MLSGFVLMILVLAVGSSLTDRLRVKQEEILLGKLDVPRAHAFYESVKKRARRVRIMRAIAILSLVVIFWVYKRRLVGDTGETAPSPSGQTPISAPAGDAP